MAVRLTIELNTTRQLEEAVNFMGRVNQAQIEDPALRGRIPPIYSGHYRYKREPPDREEWQTALQSAERRSGDCEDLCSLLLGFLWAAGEKGARARVIHVTPTLRHVMVARADGRLEDPSAKLGMGGKG